jgi:adenosylcobinamide-phosphate synthase
VTVLGLAVLLDLVAGEPPNRWHPVVWIGRLIALGGRYRLRDSPTALVLHGTLLVTVVVLIPALAMLMVEDLIAGLPGLLQVIVEAVLLKCTFSLRGLFSAVELVRGHLVAGDLPGARRELGVHLVSRATGDLDGAAVASGAVESLAENLTDAWAAPLGFFLVGGLAAAWAYRALNTADAMIGYRDGELLYLGRSAARLDDVANLVPARMAALSLIAGSWMAGLPPARAWRAMCRDAASTESPNAGWTMAAMAGALGVTLEKRAHYRLGRGPAPDPEAIDRAMRIARWSAAVWLGFVFLCLAVRSRMSLP